MDVPIQSPWMSRSKASRSKAPYVDVPIQDLPIWDLGVFSFGVVVHCRLSVKFAHKFRVL